MIHTMTYAVEIEGPNGDRAVKEYEAPSARVATLQAARELRPYPEFSIVGVRLRDGAEALNAIGEW